MAPTTDTRIWSYITSLQALVRAGLDPKSFGDIFDFTRILVSLRHTTCCANC